MNNQTAYLTCKSEEYLHTTAIFGEIKKVILTDDFKGGFVRNIFGSTELDFSHAGLTGTAILDISQAFGEISITIPADWRLNLDFAQLFNGVEDLRERKNASPKTEKVLVLTGRSVFANVEILSSL